MTICFEHPACARSQIDALRLFAIVLGLFVATLLTGCSDKKKDKPASQTAAKVNKVEITVHQINFVLAQQAALPPEKAASASAQVLERLIDQELTLQKAADQRLDRDPRVVQQVEAARRDIISRAYLEKVGEGAPKPTPQEVHAYYEQHPALFQQRRVYNLQEVNIEATPAQTQTLKTVLANAKSFAEFAAYLQANNFKFNASEAVRAAEQLPLASVEQFAQVKDGQAVFSATPTGALVLNLVSSRNQPVSSEQAVPAIELFLQNERRRKLIADDLRALRSAAKIEYLGDFAKEGAKLRERPAPNPDLPPLTTIAPPLAASAATAAPQIDVAPRDVVGASMPSGTTLDKGLKGLK